MPQTRRSFLTAAAGLGPLVARGFSREPKNVLFLAVDDLRPALNCYGASHVQSPNIDRLAARGLRFDRVYCQQAVCAPSRASLMTGLRPDSTTIVDLEHPLRETIPEAVSVAHHFKNNGYRSVWLGKIYHHHGDDPDGWSKPDWHPKRDDWAGTWQAYADPRSAAIIEEHNAAQQRAAAEAKEAGRQPPRVRFGYGPAYESPDIPDNHYPDGMVADKAIEELRRLRDQPFFLAAGFVKPHLPFNAPKKYWDLYDPASIELPSQRHWPTNSPDIARMDWGELRAYAGIPSEGPVSDDLARTLIRGYYACISYMDAQVGRVMDELDVLGLADNTAIVLWGDHGWKLNDYGAWCKHTNFEIDTRVPMILADPDHRSAAGEGTEALSEFVDIYPTLAELCGLPVPDHCEGSSMVPLLDDPGRRWKEAAFSQYPRQNQEYMGYSMRTGRHRYTEWIHQDSGEITARELYDHSDGPIATANLAGDPAHGATLERLSKLLDKGQGWRAIREAL